MAASKSELTKNPTMPPLNECTCPSNFWVNLTRFYRGSLLVEVCRALTRQRPIGNVQWNWSKREEPLLDLSSNDGGKTNRFKGGVRAMPNMVKYLAERGVAPHSIRRCPYTVSGAVTVQGCCTYEFTSNRTREVFVLPNMIHPDLKQVYSV
jgi:hypothetical protein